MRLGILIFLVAVFLSLSALAGDLFTVDGIKVASNGATAKQAKDAAVQAGQREAFGKLLERIASNTANSSLSNIDSAKLAELVQGVEANDEKVTASYYSATLNISFNKAMVEALLKDNSVNFTDKKSPPIVLVPLLIANGQNMLFEEENPLRKALTSVTSENPVLTIIVPVNLRGVNKAKLDQNIENIAPDVKDSLLKLGQNYKANKLILIAAAQGADGNLSVRLQDIKDQASPVREISFKAKDANTGEDVYEYAARGITSLLEGQWVKGGKAEATAPLTKITVTIPISGLDQWTALRKKLENLSFLREVTVKSLTVQNAIVDISFSDTPDGLNAKMVENGLFLESVGDAIILRIRSASSQMQNTENLQVVAYGR